MHEDQHLEAQYEDANGGDVDTTEEPWDDGSPCCIAYVTSGQQDHVPGCDG